jgi:hypothetical protein
MAAKNARERKAVSLLEGVIEESGLLKSLENRIRALLLAEVNRDCIATAQNDAYSLPGSSLVTA